MNAPNPTFSARLPVRALVCALVFALGWTAGWSARQSTRERATGETGAGASLPPVSPSPVRNAGAAHDVFWLSLSETGLLANARSLRDRAAADPERALGWLRESAAVMLPVQREAVLAGLLQAGREEDARAAVEGLPEVAVRHLCREAMLSALAEKDPACAFNYGMEFTLFRSGDLIQSLFARWTARDPDAATRAWNKFPHDAQRMEALAATAASLGQIDPESAVAWASTLADPEHRNTAVSLAWAGWARKDPAAVLEASGSLDSAFRIDVARQAAIEWARRDPEGARARVEGETDPDLRAAMLFAIGSEWTRSAPELAAGISSRLLVGTEESTLTVDTMRGLIHADPRRAFDWANELTATRRVDALHAAFFQLSDVDPRTAAELMAREDLPTGMEEQTRRIGRGFAEEDPAAAAAWAEQLPAGRRLDAMRGVLAGAAREDPEKALEILARQPAGERGDLVESIASGWAHRDPMAAMAWAKSLTGGERSRATAGVVELLALVAPEDAASALGSWVEETKGEPPSGLEDGYAHPLALAIDDIARNWDPGRLGEMVDWGAGLPRGKMRDEAVANIFRHWAATSPNGLAGHLQAMPPGGDRDAGAYELAIAMARADLGAATAWAASLSHPEARASAARFFMEAARDKPQAFEHITASGLMGAEETRALFE